MSFSVIQNETPDPAHVGALGSPSLAMNAELAAHFLEQRAPRALLRD
jgi:hypothetical protein